jgi:hypothetical protein
MDSTLRALLAALPDDAASFNQVIRSIRAESWPELFEESIRHGVSGLLESHLNAEAVPPEIWKAFLLHNTDQVLVYRELARSLDEVVATLNEAGIRVCTLKGPALASRLYDEPAIRVSTDLDLLVAPDDLDRAVRALRARGYVGGSEATTSYLLRHSHHLDFAKTGAAAIELHFQAYVGFGVTVPASALLDRAVEYAFSDHCNVLVPSVEDELMYLAVHAAGHSFVRLSWLYDMKILVMKNPQLNWDDVVNRSDRLGISTAVGFAIELLTRWLGMPLADVAKKFPTRGMRAGVANAMLAKAATETDRSPLSNLKGLLFTALLCNRVGSAAWLVQHHLLRSARRRVHRVSPDWVPASWSG